jgi:hypothetical protein
MSTTVIVLGTILLLVILYMIFQDYFTGKTKLTDEKSLNTNLPEISGGDLSQANSTLVTYSIWLYVNSWDTVKVKPIISREGDVNLWLDSTSATLKLNVGGKLQTNSTSLATVTIDGTSEQQEIFDITNNFPLQKWTCILVSVDNKIIDVYLDGKLVKSIENKTTISSDASNGITIGGDSDFLWDGIIARFERQPKVTDPASAYDKYAEGAGSGSLSKALGNFNINLSVLKDNVETSRFALF